jgi:hypothetical protein
MPTQGFLGLLRTTIEYQQGRDFGQQIASLKIPTALTRDLDL